MKKLILLSVSMLALTAGAETRLEDITIVINVRSCQPVMVAGGAAPVVYRAPVVYNAPVIYDKPVIYEGPVIYNSEVAPAPVCFADCSGGYSGCDYGYSTFGNSYCNPNLIRFGRIQAAREGYHFGRRR